MVGQRGQVTVRIGIALALCLMAAGAALALDTTRPPGVDGDLLGEQTGTNGNDGSGGSGNPAQDLVGDSISVPFMGRLSGIGVAFMATGIGAIAYIAFSVMGTKFVTSQNVLENDARRELYEYIKNNPGTHLRATAAALNLSTTNALWHLRKLEESNLVNSKRLDGYKVFYPVEGGLEAKRIGLAMAVLRNPNAKQILDHVLRHPSAHQREMARALGLNHGTIRWHLRKLSAVGLVVEVRLDHISQYYISELGNLALARVLGVPIGQLPPVPQVLLPVRPAQPNEMIGAGLIPPANVAAGIDTEVEA